MFSFHSVTLRLTPGVTPEEKPHYPAAMPYPTSDRLGAFYKTRFRYNGITTTAGCGTSDLRTARAVEEMIATLKRDRQHVVLTALVEKENQTGSCLRFV